MTSGKYWSTMKVSPLILPVLHFVWLSMVRTATITVFEVRRRCPSTAEAWRERKGAYICPAPAQYHCMLTPNGDLVEFCMESIWIEDDHCPQYNTKTGRIDVQLCPESGDCPRQHYLSDTVYKYPDCIKRNTPDKNHPKSEFLRGGASNSTASNEIIQYPQYARTEDPYLRPFLTATVLGQTFSFLVVILAVLSVVLMYRQHIKSNAVGNIYQNMDQRYGLRSKKDELQKSINVLEVKSPKEV